MFLQMNNVEMKKYRFNFVSHSKPKKKNPKKTINNLGQESQKYEKKKHIFDNFYARL